MTEEKMMK